MQGSSSRPRPAPQKTPGSLGSRAFWLYKRLFLKYVPGPHEDGGELAAQAARGGGEGAALAAGNQALVPAQPAASRAHSLISAPSEKPS